VTMVWVGWQNLSLRALLALHPPISPLTSSGQRNCASWASQSQKSVTLLPCPGGRTTKSTRRCGGIGKEKEYSNEISSLFRLVSLLAECLFIPFWRSCIQHAQPTTHVNNLRSTERRTQLNVHPITCHEGTEGEKRYCCTLSSSLALYVVGSLTPHPGHFTPGA